MDAVTYSNDKVVKFILDHYEPLRLKHDDVPFSEDFNLIWTPTLIVLDQEAKEYRRSIGYLESEELIAFLKLGLAMMYFDQGNHEAANLNLEEILAGYPRTDAAPEALYFRGVNSYKEKNDPKQLKKSFDELQQKYPESGWVKRALPYRNL
jgi:tetratricopeptide (TPR) repeat protein